MEPLYGPIAKGQQPLQPAIYLSRPRRWVMRVELPDGAQLDVHMADPGRLGHLLRPGETPVLLDGPFANRKTTHTVVMALADSGVWVSLLTTLPNRLFVPLLDAGLLPELWHPPLCVPELRKEVKVGHSRLDFQLRYGDGQERYVEVKSLGWARGDLGLFPDAPTVRGQKHLRTLIGIQQEVAQTAVLFVAQRSDITRVSPAWEIDVAFAQTLCEADQEGVLLLAAGVELTPEAVYFEARLPIELDPPDFDDF